MVWKKLAAWFANDPGLIDNWFEVFVESLIEKNTQFNFSKNVLFYVAQTEMVCMKHHKKRIKYTTVCFYLHFSETRLDKVVHNEFVTEFNIYDVHIYTYYRRCFMVLFINIQSVHIFYDSLIPPNLVIIFSI